MDLDKEFYESEDNIEITVSIKEKEKDKDKDKDKRDDRTDGEDGTGQHNSGDVKKEKKCCCGCQ